MRRQLHWLLLRHFDIERLDAIHYWRYLSAFGTGGAAAAGSTAYNSTYSPFYYSDSEQILRSDDLLGTNQITCCTQGFYGANAIALDSAGRIYVADTYNGRIVRIDDMQGTNWTTYGTYGSGQGQFNDPPGIAVDSAGRIYVMDTNNTRLVRIDDMNGTNWITYGTVGSGVGQFNAFISVAVDSLGRIYVADTGNVRIVRMDDMFGTNWTTLTGFTSPAAVAFDSAGKIYIADDGPPAGAVIRVDDMTGANRTLIYLGPVGTAGPNSISVDQSGTVFVGGGIGGAVKVVDNMAGVLNSSGAIGPVGPSYVFGVVALPHPNPLPPAMKPLPASLSFPNQNIGTTGPSQQFDITNFGGSPLDLVFTPSTGFVDTTTCPAALNGGSSCTVYVSFAPTVTGAITGTLNITDNSGNLGSLQTVALSGFATKPVAYVVPGNLLFPANVVNTASPAQSVVLLNIGNGPMQVSNVSAAAPFSQTNNCSAAIAPGGACTILVSFTPTATGPAGGTLTITNTAGTKNVNLAGSGATTAQVVKVLPAAILFPPQMLNVKSPVQTITITNTGATAVSFTGASASTSFAESSTCTATIRAGKSCTITVTFTPTAVGTATGTLTVNLSTGSQTVVLAGTGVKAGSLPATLSASPSPMSFNNNYVIGDNPVQKLTITNTSEASVAISKVVLSGDPSITEKNTCPADLAPGATCTIYVQFKPTAAGSFTSTLTLTEGSGAEDIVTITGQAAVNS